MKTNYLVTTRKVIGIYYYWYVDDQGYPNTCAGGTGRWFFESSRALISMGYHVILFGKMDDEGKAPSFGRHLGPYGIEIMSLEGFEYIRKTQHFDHFISIGNIEIFNEYINCDSLYIMCHNNYPDVSSKDVYYEPYKTKKILKYGVLSEHSKKLIQQQIKYYTTDNDFFVTTNGLDQTHYLDVDNVQKKNKMVWSSQPVRGLKTFLTYAYPLIKKEVPDFELEICSYLYDDEMELDQYLIDDDIHFIGQLSQKDLAKIQKEAKIWCYPNLGITDERYFFHETFCITAVENAMAKNAIICLGNKDGIQTVFNGYDSFLDGDLFHEYEIFYQKDFERVGEKMAEMAIKALKDENYRQYLVDQTYNLAKKYTWKNAAIGWVKEWHEEDFVKEWTGEDLKYE